MNDKNLIEIIGTQPPCPRCRLLTDVIKNKITELKINAEVKHIGFKEPEAVEFAKTLGLQPGTSSIVAQILNIAMEHKKIIPDDNSPLNAEYDEYLYTGWSYELDEQLRYFENNAREVGILMTPAIVINGKLKHAGSVPRISILTEWLSELKQHKY